MATPNDPLADLFLLSSESIEEEVGKTRAKAAEGIEAFMGEQSRFSMMDKVDARDDPGNNTWNNIVKGQLMKAPERVETFDEFFDRKAPATHLLNDAMRGGFDALLGRETRSTRDVLFKEFQVEQAAQQRRQELQGQNERTALQLAQRREQNRADIQAKFQLRQIDLIEDRADREEALLKWGLEHNLDVAEYKRKVENDQAERAEDKLNQVTDSKVPLVAEFRKQVNAEMPELNDKDPKAFNEEVMSRYDRALAKESNRKVAERKAGRKGTTAVNVTPQRIGLMRENVLRGNMTLAQARQVLTTEENGPEAYFQMLESGEGRVIRDKQIRTKLGTAAEGINMATQLNSLALEARAVWEENRTNMWGDRGEINSETQSFKGLKADLEGALVKLQAAVGDNAAATVMQRLIPGYATGLARAGGEEGRISDADVIRFIKQAPALTDTPEELSVLKREITTTVGRRLISVLQNEAATLGERKSSGSEPVKVQNFIRDFTSNRNEVQEKMGLRDPVEAIVRLWEQGVDFTF